MQKWGGERRQGRGADVGVRWWLPEGRVEPSREEPGTVGGDEAELAFPQTKAFGLPASYLPSPQARQLGLRSSACSGGAWPHGPRDALCPGAAGG